MREKGFSRIGVTRKLERMLSGDRSFYNGRILGSMCTAPHAFAEKIFRRYLEKNVGDPGLFPKSIALEGEVIRDIGSLLGLSEACGNIVSGGTEANILALWAAKKNAPAGRREVILSEAAHFSFDKAASLLDLDLVKIRVTRDQTIDIGEAAKKINSKTLALVGVAGSTPLGVVDPVEALSDLAVKHGLLLHVDAAFGGFVIPFARELGRSIPAFDFSLPGVQCISIDPHKMGMSVIPAGGILFRERTLAEKIRVPVPYLAGGETALATIVGTRPGAAVLATWALLRHLGRAGYRATVRACLELTDYLATQASGIPGITLITAPVLNIVGISSSKLPAEQLAKALRERGWAVSLFATHLRIVVMPHLKLKHIKKFVKDLQEIVRG